MAKKIGSVEGKIENVVLAELNVDPTYQRNEKSNRKRIRDEFDPDAVGVLHVGRRGDGSLWLIDGQQRAWAMISLGIEKWKAFVIHSNGPAYEAAIFDAINGKNRMALSSQELFRAALVSEDPVALATKRAADAAGIRLKLSLGGACQAEDTPMMACVGGLYQMTKKGGEALTTRVLSVLMRTWPKQPAALKELVPIAMGRLFYSQGSMIDDERFIEQLSVVPPVKILNDAMIGVGDRITSAQMVLCRYYNKRLKTQAKRLRVLSRDRLETESA